jgi:hypothetical protein
MTEPRCVVCGHELAPTELRTCVGCLGRTRRRLLLLARLVDVAVDLRPDLAPIVLDRTSHATVETPLPGGDLLVALGPGAPAGEGDPNDPWAVQQGLASWVRDWAETRGESALPVPTVTWLVDWLTVRCGWAAAHHDAFALFADEVDDMLSELAAWSHLCQPSITGAPCPYCRVPLRRDWTDRRRRHECVGHPDRCDWPYRHHGCADTGGLDDLWRCPRCARTYPDAAYWLAVRAQLEEIAG